MQLSIHHFHTRKQRQTSTNNEKPSAAQANSKREQCHFKHAAITAQNIFDYKMTIYHRRKSKEVINKDNFNIQTDEYAWQCLLYKHKTFAKYCLLTKLSAMRALLPIIPQVDRVDPVEV